MCTAYKDNTFKEAIIFMVEDLDLFRLYARKCLAFESDTLAFKIVIGFDFISEESLPFSARHIRKARLTLRLNNKSRHCGRYCQ